MRGLSWLPTTVDEVMKALSELLTAEEKAQLVSSTKEELVLYHMGLGRWMRNNWKLWEGGALADHMTSLGFTHPDDMSSSLIHEYWNRMNNNPSTMEDEIASYKEYWAKTLKNGEQ